MIAAYPSEADIRRRYEKRFNKLSTVAKTLQREIERQLRADKEVVLVQSRPKGIDEFVAKALRPKDWPNRRRTRRDLKPSEVRKYAYPLEDIQDQIGCRVVVKSPRARTEVALLLARHFGHLEKGYKVDRDPSRFGYSAHHVICPIPPALRAKRRLQTEAFEIQVATLFQFAWSQMEHAVGYKPGKVLTREQRRNLAAAAALAETADLLFSRVRESK
jgi:putative GTP pyrophosphokinase